jgi:hypothetical protein
MKSILGSAYGFVKMTTPAADDDHDSNESTQPSKLPRKRSTEFLDENLSPDSIVVVSDGIANEMFKISFLVEQMPALRTLLRIREPRRQKEFFDQCRTHEFDKACAAAAAAAAAADAAKDARTNVGTRIDKFTKIFDLIESAPNRAKSTSTSRSGVVDTSNDQWRVTRHQRRNKSTMTKRTAMFTNDQLDAAVHAPMLLSHAKAQPHRSAENSPILSASGHCRRRTNAVWHAAADAIFENFDWPNRELRPMIPLSAGVQQLQAFRNKPASVRAEAGFPREFEVKVTHPAVFAVLDETTQPLATLLTGEYLHLYKENVGGHCERGVVPQRRRDDVPRC